MTADSPAAPAPQPSHPAHKQTHREKRRTSTNWAIMAPVRGQIRWALALSCLSALCTLAALLALAASVRALTEPALTEPALLEPPAAFPVLYMGLALAATIAAYVLRRLSFDQSHYAGFKLETILRTQLTQHIAQLSLGSAQRVGAGGLAKVVFDDVKALHVFVADSTPLYARAYFLPVATFILLLWLDWRLALAALAVLLAGVGMLTGIMKNRADIMRRYNEEREKVSSAIVEFVQAMPVVRTFDTGQTTFGRYQRALENYLHMLGGWWRKTGLAAKTSMAILSPMPTLAVLLWLGAWMLWGGQGTLDFATWIAILLLGTGMAEALMPLHSLGHLIDTAKLSIGRIQQILALPVLPPAASNGKTPQDASVVFEDVSFRYDQSSAPALEHVSFTAAPGTVTALVGPSGAGKTTVARLIPRFWDVSGGRILVGGVDVRELPLDTLMAQVSFVFQDTFLFAASITENIRLGLPDATQQDVQAAARAAQAHDFITQLPQGYATCAGERGVFLSGGQRQRITIARAILQNRPILVLDEATAFADPENEAAIVAALSELMRGKTVLMVAHRLSTITDADQILVFDQGRLCEQGRHDALLGQNGVYARLWDSYQQAQNWALRGTAASPCVSLPAATSTAEQDAQELAS